MEPDDRLEHKLAAILHADIVGYTRLSSDDEEGIHRKLREYLDYFSETIQSHGGRVVGTAGDAVLAEFSMSPVHYGLFFLGLHQILQ